MAKVTKMKKCDYCGKIIAKAFHVGPGIDYCNVDCYDKACITQYPGTTLADMTAEARPDIAKELGYKLE